MTVVQLLMVVVGDFGDGGGDGSSYGFPQFSPNVTLILSWPLVSNGQLTAGLNVSKIAILPYWVCYLSREEHGVPNPF